MANYISDSSSGSRATAPAVGRIPFPLPEDFERDQRCSFSKLDDQWELVDDDGSEWVFDVGSNRWIPALNEEDLAKQQEVYIPKDNDSDTGLSTKKRKNGDENDGPPKKAKKTKSQSGKKNTAVYITSIPLDADVKEVKDVFSRYGVIAEEIDSGRPRIKMYNDEEGKFKGEALVSYFRPESVDLAIQMLDDSDFRMGQEGPSGKMRVNVADMSYKKVQRPPDGENRAKGSSKDEKKIKRKTNKLNKKLADWDDDDPQALSETSSRWDKVVILRHMFTLKELDESPESILDIKEDIREECSKFGEVTNVVLFDKEADGIVSVRFSNTQAANACERAFDGRWFGGQKIEAYIADGGERFKRTSDTNKGEDPDNENEEDKRLDEFGKWLETDEQD